MLELSNQIVLYAAQHHVSIAMVDLHPGLILLLLLIGSAISRRNPLIKDRWHRDICVQQIFDLSVPYVVIVAV